MVPIETSPSGRHKTLRLHKPKAFMENLYASFKRCRSMELDGSSKAAVGWAFYKAMCELFGEDYGEIIDAPDPHAETTPITPPRALPVAHPLKR